ncbi:MAG: ATP phosphoribosyltransferase [Patescibacteria group bacterium]
MLKIALPSGSLEEQTLRLFKEADLEVIRGLRQQKGVLDHGNFKAEITIMRPQIIPKLVERGNYHLGICGWDCVVESGATGVILVEKLNYSRFTSGNVKVVLFGSVDDLTQKASEIKPGSRILSEYPNYTRRFFEEQGLDVEIDFSSGTTEAHIPDDYPYGVCVSERGKSINANKQKVIQVLFESATTLIANQKIMESERGARTVRALKLLLVGTLEARRKVLLTMNVPKDKMAEVIKLLPAMKAPTVSKLWEQDYFSVSAVVDIGWAGLFIPALLEAGAEDLIQQPISKVIKSW